MTLSLHQTDRTGSKGRIGSLGRSAHRVDCRLIMISVLLEVAKVLGVEFDEVKNNRGFLTQDRQRHEPTFQQQTIPRLIQTAKARS